MNKYGFKPTEWQEMLQIFTKNSALEKVVIFGSRAKNTFKPMSDVDIAVYGNLRYADISQLESDLEDSNLPFLFDVVQYASIQSEELLEHIRRYGGAIYLKGWEKTTLGEVCDINSSKRIYAKEYRKSGIPFFRGKEITEKLRGNEISTELFISKTRYDEIKERYGVPTENDILLTSVGTLGNPYLVEKDFRFYFKDGNLTWFRNFSNINSRFLFYWIISSQGKENLSHAKIGSTQEAYTMEALKKVKICIPPLHEQKSIAAVLSSLDDKIELLQEENKTLEETIETLFKYYFNDNSTEKSFKRGILSDEFYIIMGQSPQGKYYNSIGAGTPMFQGNSDFGFRFPKNRIYTTETKRIAETFDTLISVRAPVGEQNMASEKCCIGRGLAAFRYKKDSQLYTYTYFKLRSLIQSIKQFNKNGTVFGSISKSDFQNLPTIIPSQKLIDIFQCKAKPIDDKIIQNIQEVSTLQTTRDTLLPKLMDGSIRVNDLEA